MISLPFASTSTGGKNGGREVYPLPFREPVSTAPTVALEFHHAAAALRASRLMIDKMMLELDSPAGKNGMVDLRSLSQVYRRDYCATCNHPLQTEDQFQTASYVRKDSYSGRIATSLSLPLTSIWHVTEHPRSPPEKYRGRGGCANLNCM
jgi:hypothetical protein